jgi:hypothetical protein
MRDPCPSDWPGSSFGMTGFRRLTVVVAHWYAPRRPKGSRSPWGKEVGGFPGASALVTGHSHEAKDVVSSTDNGKWVIK